MALSQAVSVFRIPKPFLIKFITASRDLRGRFVRLLSRTAESVILGTVASDTAALFVAVLIFSTWASTGLGSRVTSPSSALTRIEPSSFVWATAPPVCSW